ncbi:hypothetical protein [Bradyrhizobium sp. AZCC 2289]|uniref:hypothetical protein n=1 Tax=Bradyrhizobium sp. AZCC 2289 TaxID=3117026 RepID=UPI002FF077EE
MIQKTDEIVGELVSTDNLSLPGAAALLAYAIEHVDAGYLWPDRMEAEEGQTDRGFGSTSSIAPCWKRCSAPPRRRNG